MGNSQALNSTQRSPDKGGRFTWPGLVLAVVAGPAFGVVWAWTGEVAQFYFAPMVLFPLLVGILTGLTVVGLVRFTQIGHRPTIVLAAVLAAIVAAGGQHYFHYLSTYPWSRAKVSTNTSTVQNLSALAPALTPSFREYIEAQAKRGRPLLGGCVARGWVAWLTWAIDAMLIVVAAVVVTLPAMRVPYCNRCGSWYRTVRGGRIDLSTARRLAAICGVDEVGETRSSRYRLSSCQGGCDSTRCELSWEESGGVVDLVRVWLDTEKRNQVVAILDGLGEQEDKSVPHE